MSSAIMGADTREYKAIPTSVPLDTSHPTSTGPHTNEASNLIFSKVIARRTITSKTSTVVTETSEGTCLIRLHLCQQLDVFVEQIDQLPPEESDNSSHQEFSKPSLPKISARILVSKSQSTLSIMSPSMSTKISKPSERICITLSTTKPIFHLLIGPSHQTLRT